MLKFLKRYLLISLLFSSQLFAQWKPDPNNGKDLLRLYLSIIARHSDLFRTGDMSELLGGESSELEERIKLLLSLDKKLKDLSPSARDIDLSFITKLEYSYSSEGELIFSEENISNLKNDILNSFDLLSETLKDFVFSNLKTDILKILEEHKDVNLYDYFKIAPFLYDIQGNKLFKSFNPRTMKSVRSKIEGTSVFIIENKYKDVFKNHMSTIIKEMGNAKSSEGLNRFNNKFLNGKLLQEALKPTSQISNLDIKRTRAVLEELPSVAALYRSYYGHDCSSWTIPLYPLLKGVRVFIITKNNEKNPRGYALIAEMGKENHKTPYIITINGTLNNVDIKQLIKAVAVLYNSEEVMVPNFKKTMDVVNQGHIKTAMHDFDIKREVVRTDFPKGWDLVNKDKIYGSYYKIESIKNMVELTIPDGTSMVVKTLLTPYLNSDIKNVKEKDRVTALMRIMKGLGDENIDLDYMVNDLGFDHEKAQWLLSLAPNIVNNEIDIVSQLLYLDPVGTKKHIGISDIIDPGSDELPDRIINNLDRYWVLFVEDLSLWNKLMIDESIKLANFILDHASLPNDLHLNEFIRTHVLDYMQQGGTDIIGYHFLENCVNNDGWNEYVLPLIFEGIRSGNVDIYTLDGMLTGQEDLINHSVGISGFLSYIDSEIRKNPEGEASRYAQDAVTGFLNGKNNNSAQLGRILVTRGHVAPIISDNIDKIIQIWPVLNESEKMYMAFSFLSDTHIVHDNISNFIINAVASNIREETNLMNRIGAYFIDLPNDIIKDLDSFNLVNKPEGELNTWRNFMYKAILAVLPEPTSRILEPYIDGTEIEDALGLESESDLISLLNLSPFSLELTLIQAMHDADLLEPEDHESLGKKSPRYVSKTERTNDLNAQEGLKRYRTTEEQRPAKKKNPEKSDNYKLYSEKLKGLMSKYTGFSLQTSFEDLLAETIDMINTELKTGGKLSEPARAILFEPVYYKIILSYQKTLINMEVSLVDIKSYVNRKMIEDKEASISKNAKHDRDFKIRNSIISFIFNGSSSPVSELSNEELIDRFFDKALRDLGSTDLNTYTLAVGMLFSEENIEFFREIGADPSFNSWRLTAYNTLINSLIDFRVSSKGLVYEPEKMFRLNDKLIKDAQENIRVSFGRYRAIGR